MLRQLKNSLKLCVGATPEDENLKYGATDQMSPEDHDYDYILEVDDDEYVKMNNFQEPEYLKPMSTRLPVQKR